MKIAALAAVAILGGCGIDAGSQKASHPGKDVQVIAVFPFINQTREPRIDGAEMADLLANEILKVEGLQVVRPARLGGGAPSSPEEALKWARAAKADAALVTAVTDYDPFEPPRIALSIQFLRVQGRAVSSADIDRIVQSASWRRGPLSMGRDKAANWIDAFETVYDAREKRTRREIAAYAAGQAEGDSAFAPERELTAVQSRYLQFVASRVVNRLFERAAAE